MAYFPYRRLSWGGSIYDAASGGAAREIWNCSLAVTQVAFTSDIEAELALAVPLVSAWHNVGPGFVNQTVALEYVKYNAFGADGLQTTDPTNEHLLTAPFVRGTGTTLVPNQIAMRISLDNGTRARRARGGFYMPKPNVTLGLDGLWASASCGAVADGAKTFIDGLNSALEGSVCIASGVDATNRVVTRVRVGRVPDTIRTRRNALMEGYLERAVA